MRNFLTLIILLFAAHCYSTAQSSKLPVEVTMGEVTKIKKMMPGEYIGYFNGHHIFTRSMNYSDMAAFYKAGYVGLISYNDKLEFVLEAETEFEVDGEKTNQDMYFLINDNLYSIAHIRNSKSKLSEYYACRINTETLAFEGQPLFLYKSSEDLDSASVVLSEDKSKFAIVAYPEIGKAENITFDIYVFNNQMEKLWDRKINTEYTDKTTELIQFRLGNDGIAYGLFRVYKDKAKPVVDERPNYSYKIITFRPEADDNQEYTADLGDRFITDLRFHISSDNQLVLAGYYSEAGAYSAKGCYFMHIDPQTNEVVSKAFKEFSESTLSVILKDKNAQKPEAELANFVVRDVVNQKDGSTIILGEKYYVTIERRWKDGRMYTYYTHHYDHILISKVDAAGFIQWSTIIPHWGYQPCSFGFDAAGTYIVYNDIKENIKAMDYDDLKIKIFGKQVPVLGYIDNNGSLAKYQLFDNPEGLYLMPKTCGQVTDEMFFIYAKDPVYHQAGYFKLQPN